MREVARFAVVLVLAVVCGGCHPKTPPAPKPEPSAAERLSAAKAALANGDCDRARPDLDAAVKARPELFEAQVLRGICAFKQHDPQTGEQALSLAMKADPSSPLPYEALGIALYGLDRREAAKQALDTAVSKGSKDPRISYYLGNLAMFAGDCRAAFTAYRRATVLDPAFLPAQTEFDAARRACAKGIVPKPAASSEASRP